MENFSLERDQHAVHTHRHKDVSTITLWTAAAVEGQEPAYLP